MKPQRNPKHWVHRYVVGETTAHPEVKPRCVFEEERPSGTPDERGVMLVLGAGDRRRKYIIGAQVKDVMARTVRYRVYEVQESKDPALTQADIVAAVKRAPHQTAMLLAQLLGGPFAVCRAIGSYREEEQQ